MTIFQRCTEINKLPYATYLSITKRLGDQKTNYTAGQKMQDYYKML